MKKTKIYLVLEYEMWDRGITKKDISVALGISERALRNKLDGVTEFTWPEICLIQKTFFPEINKEELFAIDPFTYARYLINNGKKLSA